MFSGFQSFFQKLAGKIGLSATEFRFLSGLIGISALALILWMFFREEPDITASEEFRRIDSIFHSITLAADSSVIDVPTSRKTAGNIQINLNTASLEELQSIPGVGEKTAQSIINYRKKAGAFQSAAELENIPGLGHSRVEKIRKYLIPDSLLAP